MGSEQEISSWEEAYEQFEKEYQEETTTEELKDELVEEVEITNETDPTNDADNLVGEETALNEEKSEINQLPEDQHMRNEAFATLRKERDSFKKYADVIMNIAEKNGITPDELVKNFENKRLEEEAKNQNVPVDVLKRLQSLEAENERIRNEQFSKQFNESVDKTKQEFGLSEQDVTATIDFMVKNGFADKISFEQAYKLANFDTIMTKAKEQAQQEYLEKKQEKQSTAAIPHGNQNAQISSNEWSDDEFNKMLKTLDINI